MARASASGQTRPASGTQEQTRQPPLFKVLMHNDDYTTMEFVVEALQKVFHKPPTEANRIMLHIHFKGVGLCGIFPYEVAETKISRVHAMAHAQGYPLRCTLDRV
ncbi:MAG: ATP-dependent Clp protease adaptor ClpS [Desulfuromonadales bacterium]|nr:ATP-dependent Clp protease adaptor ClpS [Desulfuromonadales bacterium]